MAGEEVEVRPAIVAPVSRLIAVRDMARGAAFYRDVLGFDIHDAPDGTEASSGHLVVGCGLFASRMASISMSWAGRKASPPVDLARRLSTPGLRFDAMREE